MAPSSKILGESKRNTSSSHSESEGAVLEDLRDKRRREQQSLAFLLLTQYKIKSLHSFNS
jgi:hypothetical protein